MDLAAVREANPERARERVTVGAYVRVLIGGEQTEVETLIRPAREPTTAGREQHASAGQFDPDVVARNVERVGKPQSACS